MEDNQLPSEVGLDDLFGRPTGVSSVTSEELSDHSPMARWLVGRIFFSVALACVIYGFLYFMKLVVPLPLLMITIFVITLVRHLLSQVSISPLPPQLTGRGMGSGSHHVLDVHESDSGHDGVGLAVRRWVGILDSPKHKGTLHGVRATWLGELVDERMRLRHGFTRASDPGRAREMMGEQLWLMLHNPSTGGLTPHDMAIMVKRIEEL